MKTCNHCGAGLLITTLSAEGLGLPGQYCGMVCVLGEALTRITQKQEGQRAGWISVDERLPDFGIPVLIHVGTVSNRLNGPRVEIGMYLACLYGEASKEHPHRWGLHFSGFIDPECVTHWQPLPKPPVVEQKREAGRCGDCRHWHMDESFSDIGTCYVSNHALRMQDERTASGFSRVKIRETANTWGCIQFEPKRGNDE